jgi:hypothetical protein
MSPVQTNTQQGLITVKSTTDWSSYVGRFVNIGSDGHPAFPSAGGVALYVIEDAYAEGGYFTPPSNTLSGVAYKVTLRPLSPDRNVRVVAGDVIACAAQIASTAAGLAVTASASASNKLLAFAEEAGVSGQYILIRPLGGVNVAY